ncbi:MAG: thermonuclease family protein, partial [Candidatus Bipolaricaulota bacterium]
MRRRLASLMLVFLVALASGAPPAVADVPDPAHATIDTRVLKILDGDTVDVRGGTRVRLLNIDTPEVGQPYSDEAIAYAKGLLQFKNVRLELDVKERDAYDRTLAYVYVETDDGWVLANLEIVRAGLARLLIIPPNGKYRAQFEEALLDAMVHRRGIWGAVGGVITVAELEEDILDVVNEVVTVRFAVAAMSETPRGLRIEPAETRLRFHTLISPSCELMALK